MSKLWTVLIASASITLLLTGCGQSSEPAASADTGPKIGILLVNHGSEQKAWRDMLVDVEKAVDDKLLALPNVQGVKTAFNEYTEPSIATQMKAFDDEGYDEVIALPLFLTVGGHTNSDLPNGLGLKNDKDVLESLPKEGVPVYRPRARVTLLETIDATEFLKTNILRRTKSLLEGVEGSDVGVTLAAYGDQGFNQQWEELMTELGEHLKENLDIDIVNSAWSGHLVNYSIEPTKKAINQILEEKKKNVLISVYVAYDYMFQRDIIGEAGRQSIRPDDVLYNEPEAILPDENLNNWVVQSIEESLTTGRLARLIGS
ncbi:MAG: CbiX/SirB N-terminal domain-containing protein [Gammaproteobacteria bacterium]|nr:cobalamin biosynthesis protein CbiX [Chromatiales bacterium]MDP6675540.1 CbiX/SirB N-terminal domain-containing protein [Gammaproteobacteria bacterium]